MVSVKNLTVCLGQQTILDKVSCQLIPGRITTFIGKSGAGKTTLLKALIDLVPHSDGEITVNNKKLSLLDSRTKSETIGYVFQDFNLFLNMTVLENCIDPLLVHGVAYQDAYSRAVQQLEGLEMGAHLTKYPSQLSGGQQQRVAIARSLCLNPQVLLFDEPTASLDPINTTLFIEILQSLVARNMTIGISSQDMSFVKKIMDRVYYIKTGSITEFCDITKPDTSCLEIQKFISNYSESSPSS